MGRAIVNCHRPVAPTNTAARTGSAGDEWDTTFTFTQPGCWPLHVTRGASLNSDVWLMVSA